jgi:hypothetical protein
LHVAALAVWLGAIGMTVAAAAIVFPTMQKLDPHLAAFDKYTGSHAVLAGDRCLAGVPGVRRRAVCVRADRGVTFGIAVMWLGLSVQRVSTFVRAALLLGLVGMLAYRFGFQQPAWDSDLKAYWEAAGIGDNAAAATIQERLRAAHPVQERMMAVTAGMVGAALVIGIVVSPRERRS